MADTGLLIGMGFLTGGVGMPIISAVTMGSRAYVSTLNDALDRGINDGKAFALAFTAAVVETAVVAAVVAFAASDAAAWFDVGKISVCPG